MDDPRDESPPGEDYFNDLSQQPSANGADKSENAEAPKAKRCSACTLCRKRKLKCDGARPACSTCSRLQHACSYDEVRKKSGPKRGYVKLLEARLAQVETLLKTQADPSEVTTANRTDSTSSQRNDSQPPVNVNETMPPSDFLAPAQTAPSIPSFDILDDGNATAEETYPWEMISLGLDEPLPIQPVVDELNQAFFEKVHLSLPMMHRPRYYAAMHLAPHTRPPVCLRYAMWCNAAATMTDKYDGLQEHFYHRARKYVQQDEMKGHGESMLTIAHVQTWVLLATYEFRKMYFPRAWMSSGRASRMAQMMGLSRLDTSGLQVKQCLSPARDWTEEEERRRTFWAVFCVDRYSSIGTGWPMSIEELDIQTKMPGSEQAFDLSKPEKTIHLWEAFEPSGPSSLSSFGGVVLMAALFGRNLTHLHRPTPDDHDDDLDNGEFWKRHRDLDSVLLNTALSLPDELRLPLGLNNPNVVFMNMNIHTSTICLHQAAIFKTDKNKNRIPARVSADSKVRCITAAAETASIMRSISHLDLSGINPFVPFCLYVAARVFVQYLRSRPNDHQVGSSLRFLLSAMHALKRKNPLTESFLVQLDVDLEGAGLNSLRMQSKKTQDAGDYTNAGDYTQTCAIHGLGNKNRAPPTYGDLGLAAYNKPNQNIVDARTSFDAIANPNGTINISSSHLELPNRQRTPGTFISEMDTSPDGSGGDQQGSGSSTNNVASSHTSSTAYSPQQQLQVDPNQLTAVFDNGSQTFNQGYNSMHGVQEPGGAFIPVHNWEGTVQAVPENVVQGTGFGALGGGELGDVMAGMSDAEWNNVLDSMSGWDSGLDHGGMIR